MEVLQGDIVYDHIICPLHERRVDITKRDHPLFGKPGGKSYRMPFGNPDVERPLRERFHHIGHGTTSRHGRGNSHDPFVLFGQFDKGMPENILVKLRFVQLVDNNPFSSFLVEQARGMPFRRRLFGGLESFAFLCLDMQQLRPFHIFYIVQHLDHIIDIMPVDRAEVTDAESLEQVVLLRE